MNPNNICKLINDFILSCNPEAVSRLSINDLKISSLRYQTKQKNTKLYQDHFHNMKLILNERIEIDDNKEEVIFKELFSINPGVRLYHYTTFESLFSIWNYNTIRYSSLAGMNDSSEMAYSYRSLLLENDKNNINNKNRAMNQRYVLSCSLRRDDLNQWRLYGDDGKGVCIEIVQDSKLSSNFYIGRIKYRDEFIKNVNMLQYKIAFEENSLLTFKKLYLWRSFIKNIDYSDEEEIRILYMNDISKKRKCVKEDWIINRYGILSKYITFKLITNPFQIRRIILGPKLKEPKINKIHLEGYLKLNNYNDIKVIQSENENYR